MTPRIYKNNLFRFLILLFCIISTNDAICQVHNNNDSNRIVVKADSVAQVGENFRVEYQYFCKKQTDIYYQIPPNFKQYSFDYDVVYGPSKSENISQNVSNGEVVSSEYSIAYVYILNFKKIGTCIIPPMGFELANGEVVFSDSISVQVKKQIRNHAISSDSAASKSRGEILVVEAKTNNQSINIGDSIECEILLYTDMDLGQVNYATLPVNNAYWHRYDSSDELTLDSTIYNGKPVKTILLDKYSIIPLQPGRTIIEPLKVNLTLYERIPDADPFEMFFNGGSVYTEKDTIIETKAIEIIVNNKERPFKDIKLKTFPQQKNIGLIIDRSSSLFSRTDSLAPFFMELENQFVEQLLEVMDQPSITLFAGKPHYPTSSELKNITKVMPSKENDGSAIYDAIIASALHEGALTAARSHYSILLLTDGSDNASHISEKTLEVLLKKHNIRVDVIAFGCKNDSIYYTFNDPDFSSASIMSKNRQDFTNIERLAKATNGMFLLIEEEKQIPTSVRKAVQHILKEPSSMDNTCDDFHFVTELLHHYYKEITIESESDF